MNIAEPTPLQLKTEVAHHNRQRANLIKAIPDLDDETLADTLEGITDLNEMIAHVLRSALVDEALCAGLKQRVKDMKARLDRLADRSKSKRTLASQAMKEAQLKQLIDAEFTAFLRKGGLKLYIADEGKIPKDYWLPQPAKLDRHSLIQVLKTEKSVPGVHLIEGDIQLSMRVK